MASVTNPCGDGECRNKKTNKCKNIDKTQYKSETSELPDQCETLSIFKESDVSPMEAKLNETLNLLLELKPGNFVFGKTPKQFLVLLSDIENIIKKEHLEHKCYKRLEEIREKYDYIVQNADKKIPDMSPVKPWAIESLDNSVIQSINDKLGDSTLREHQKRPAAYLLENDRLLAVHGTGTGKTLVAIFAAEIFIKNNTLDNVSSPKVIFTAPPGLIRNFENNLAKLDIIDENYQVLTYNQLISLQKSGLYDGTNTLLIIDEAHNLRNPKSVKSTYMREAAYNSRKVLMLTATPFVNNFNDFVPIINMLYSGDLLSNDQDFTKYWKVDSTRFGENIQKLNDYLKDRIDYFPTNYNDPNFPTKIEQKRIIQMKPQYLEPYKELLDGRAKDLIDIYNILNPNTPNSLTAEQSFKIIYENPGAFYNGCRRLVNTLYKDPGTLREFNLLEVYISEKINEAVNIIKQNGSKKTIIYTNWIKQGITPITKVLDEQGYQNKYQIYTGALNIDDRDEIVQKYNNINDSSAEILIMSAAGSEGIDLKCTNTVIVVDPPWNKANLEQIVGRAARFKSHYDDQCEDKTVKVYYMILTTPSDNPLNTTASINQVKLGDILLYDIIEEKDKTTNRLNNMFKLITIGNPVFAAEETHAFPVLEKTEAKLSLEIENKPASEPEKITPTKPEITSDEYFDIFKKFIDELYEKGSLNDTTPRQLKTQIVDESNSSIQSEDLNKYYNNNKQQILDYVKNKLIKDNT
jgi:SNF2 family DNA or RNA helicase